MVVQLVALPVWILAGLLYPSAASAVQVAGVEARGSLVINIIHVGFPGIACVNSLQHLRSFVGDSPSVVYLKAVQELNCSPNAHIVGGSAPASGLGCIGACAANKTRSSRGFDGRLHGQQRKFRSECARCRATATTYSNP